jgi:endonuclease G
MMQTNQTRLLWLAAVGAIVALAAMSIAPQGARAADHSTFEATSEAKKHYVAFFVRGGYPRNQDVEHPVTILVNEGYVVGYVEKRKNPAWSAYHVDRISAKLAGQDERLKISHHRPDQFYTDTRIPADAQLSGSQTFGSPYERGHMTPNNAIQKEFGRLAQLETFFMTNMCPQLGTLNGGLWRTLEHKITQELVWEHDDIWVIAGPIFSGNPPHIRKGNTDTGVDIPEAFYMILIEQTHWSGTLDAIAFRFPNDATGLTGKTLPDSVWAIRDIEEETKLDFLSELSATKQDNLEVEKGEFDEWFGN